MKVCYIGLLATPAPTLYRPTARQVSLFSFSPLPPYRYPDPMLYCCAVFISLFCFVFFSLYPMMHHSPLLPASRFRRLCPLQCHAWGVLGCLPTSPVACQQALGQAILGGYPSLLETLASTALAHEGSFTCKTVEHNVAERHAVRPPILFLNALSPMHFPQVDTGQARLCGCCPSRLCATGSTLHRSSKQKLGLILASPCLFLADLAPEHHTYL